MRNIQVIDGAENCVYDIFAASDADYALIFARGEDVAFIDEVIARHRRSKGRLDLAFKRIWRRRVSKRDVAGIHGTLFYELPAKKAYYPTRRDDEATNPGGGRIR